ncbi:MAG: hypothetical protein RMN24_02945 [Anaerolineae bacterium]|nr:hypothetical protein [Anaerolineae bacterium]
MHTYLFPSRVEGSRVVATAGEQAIALGGRHAFIVADPGIVAAGLLEP